MRTQQEILSRIEQRKKGDPLGFEWPIYFESLTFENAKPFIKEDATKESWGEPKTVESIRQEAIEYMPFAWEKANDCRGISANRSIYHYMAWLWLLGEDGFDDLFDSYEYYGKPQLERVCKYFVLDPKKWDDGIRTNGESDD